VGERLRLTPPPLARARVAIEVCCTTAAGVAAAAAAGADRVELCRRLELDGLTPEPGLVAVALRSPLRVHAMVRPRAGDHRVDAATLARMRDEVALLRRLGAHGVVLGCLDAAGGIDGEATARLVDAARPMAVTFHRALDACRDRAAAIDALAALGVDRVLTSGGPWRAADPAGLAITLALARGRLGVIAAGGIRAANVAALVAASGVTEVHFSERLPLGSGEDLAAAMTRIVRRARAATAAR
jgi:copper homeostasis protein